MIARLSVVRRQLRFLVSTTKSGSGRPIVPAVKKERLKRESTKTASGVSLINMQVAAKNEDSKLRSSQFIQNGLTIPERLLGLPHLSNGRSAITCHLGQITLTTGEVADFNISLYRPELLFPKEFDIDETTMNVSQDHSIEWAKNFGLINNATAEQYIAKARFAYNLRYGLLNRVSIKDRNLQTDFASWYFYVDDVVDEIREIAQLDSLNIGEVIYALIDILVGKQTTIPTSAPRQFGDARFGDIYLPLCAATLDMRRRILELTPTHGDLVCNRLATWLRTVVVESEFHKDGQLVPEYTYSHFRELNIGMYPMFELAAQINRFENYAKQDQFLNRHRYLGAMLIILMNDIVSLPKDFAVADEGRINNLVLIRYRQLLPLNVSNPFQTALNQCITVFNQELHAWDQTLKRQFGASENSESKLTAAMFFNGVLSNLDWHFHNDRYSGRKTRG